MSSNTIVSELIAETYGPEEAQRHLSSEISRADRERAEEAGDVVLTRSRVASRFCIYLSAMWTAILRDVFSLPAYCVTGDLRVRGQLVFGSSDPMVARTPGISNEQWDAHCWLVLGPYLGDASIFRTAYAQSDRSNLKQAIVEQFGLGCGLMLMRDPEWLAEGFEYIPKYVLPDDVLRGAIKNATALGLIRGA